jgi:hypothetical protein
MASSDKVQKLIADWQAAQAPVKLANPSGEPIRGYEARYGRHDIERDRAAEEARAAEALAREFISKRSGDV